MNCCKKYGLIFVLNAFLFSGVLCLIDWNSLDQLQVYGNIFQGLAYGLFMTLYYYWDNNRKKNK